MAASLTTIFFDLDETLWDFRKNSIETLNDLLRLRELQLLGLPAAPFVERYHLHNDHCWALYHRGAITREELRLIRWQRTLNDFRIEDDELAGRLSEQYLEILPTKKHLLEDARELLDYLKPRYHLHIITNGFEKVQLQKIQTSGLTHYFTHIITSERAGCKKPDPKIFAFALRLTGAVLEESLFVGDSPEADIAGAQAAGMNYYWFNPERKTPPFPVERMVYTLAELQKVL